MNGMVAALIVPLYVSILSLIFGFDEAELVFAGDAMQHQAQLDASRNGKNSYEYTGYFDGLPSCVAMADLAIVNLEAPVSSPSYSGYPCFNAPPAFAQALKDAGFDIFLTANNHTLDRGARGLRATVANLDSMEVIHLGTYPDMAARQATLPLIREVNNIKIAFLNYTYGTNGINPTDGVVVDYIDRDRIKADVDSARAAGAEAIAVCIHWGDEYVLLPNKQQKNTADFLEAIGVDMIIGAHPHVIQPMELRPNRYHPEKNVFLVYSLGNFVSNMKTPDTRGGAIARVKLRRGDDNIISVTEADYKLIFTIPGTSPASNFRVVEAKEVDNPAWRQRAQTFISRAKGIFDKHNIGVPEASE